MVHEQINTIVQQSEAGYQYLQQLSLAERAALMHAIADAVEALDETLIQTAHEESALPLARLQGEKGRTVGQWRSYANAIRTGIYAEARIDKAGEGKADIRKYNKGIGPVAVFGASNFPFAFSTAGGDTASAIGAGCSVVFKEHPAHPRTSQLMAQAIAKGLASYGAPESVFTYVQGSSHAIGEALVLHPAIKAVAFTGSFQGGKALFDLGAKRAEPIPVFSEMGSVNPVFAFPEYLAANPQTLAAQYIGSLTLGVGQFCTNPGVFLAVSGEAFQAFKLAVSAEINNISEAKMLHEGIQKAYDHGKHKLTGQPEVSLLATGQVGTATLAQAAVFVTTGKAFLTNEHLSEEVFGPTGLLVECADAAEMYHILDRLSGQLTITFAATDTDVAEHKNFFMRAQEKCGRLLFNGMPTGVEVVYGMHHGGPFPATTDARFTSVGPDAVKRFLRPVSFQNWPNTFLPAELQEENPLQIARIVDGQYRID
ncbi:aldehyde dehydrogenase (NADP(+)) [Sphingobacterium psychroaquaticum]|uniref:NADP-dependent aldehyde dehydrogenase n=1 Tax=Sphingobacterium psychroaquaticum TaxID=561061 RepID=A0A1X7I5C8_9SPHI|nr:aldehyde dehydrogenase (NADP(+)) [Sphingobacterium psychroaquaticum]QBQ41925.1 aldehyde dehydrogenase (NADP(+)) [Sphingobacterium psychroaquaticum]SMG09281.1 NADP-dependent aldehyde dehydrogenase [Sphingobacterium psychroaquaticum]